MSLGHGPFEKKLDRLDTIIKKSLQNGEKLGRVELDFAGKAFIQKQIEKREL